MVFKPFGNLARQTLPKTFAYGYAQSVLVASQSPHHQTTGTPVGHPLGTQYARTAQLQKAFQTHKLDRSTTRPPNGESAIPVYHAAYQQAQKDEDENNKPFLHSTRLGWTPRSKDRQEVAEGVPQTQTCDEPGHSQNPLKSHSSKASINLGVDNAGLDPEEVPFSQNVSAKVDEAVVLEMKQLEEKQENGESLSVSDQGEESLPLIQGSPLPSIPQQQFVQKDTTQSNVDEKESQFIAQLAARGQYASIPAAFESLLKSHTPTTKAYNAFLESTVHLHPYNIAVLRAMDIHADMVRRNVPVNRETYQILLQLLTSRSLTCLNSKTLLEQQLSRFGSQGSSGKFILPSSEAEYERLVEDKSLSRCLQMFSMAVSQFPGISFDDAVYHTLITICAHKGDADQLIRIVAHMESTRSVPRAAIFPIMIDTFAARQNSKSAIECYNEYKSLAMADDNHVFSIIGRADGDVYASLVRAYLMCGNAEGAVCFFEKFATCEPGENDTNVKAFKNKLLSDSFIRYHLSVGAFSEALEIASTRFDDPVASKAAFTEVCIAAADANDSAIATHAYNLLGSVNTSLDPAVAMLAHFVRQGDLVAAKPFWQIISSASVVSPALIHPTAMYVLALLQSGNAEEAFIEVRAMFAQLRVSLGHSAANISLQQHMNEEITETVELLCRNVIKQAAVLSPTAVLTFIWVIFENAIYMPRIVDFLLSHLNRESIKSLTNPDLALVLQLQAEFVGNRIAAETDSAHQQRFIYSLEIAMAHELPVNTLRHPAVEAAVEKLEQTTVVSQYKQYIQQPPSETTTAFSSSSFGQISPPDNLTTSSPPAPVVQTMNSTSNPYAETTDYRGSTIITEELEKPFGQPQNHLSNAIFKLNNMRNAGLHPRFVTYAKLIAASARCGRMDAAHQVLGMAREDVPVLPQYPAVKSGWTGILDAMVAANLRAGDRVQADHYHQELLAIGSAPSANTFGLYITTFKGNTKTTDEATEALRVFQRAVSEGAEPTSFLYNVLIGKLGKARRIDDCLTYFAQMRSKGVRATSVTYGTIVNALCRVSDETFAEEMFNEMESMPNYNPRPAPYNAMIQYFLNTKLDRAKVLEYYERMLNRGIKPTLHTYKLLIDSYASLKPVQMDLAENVLEKMRATSNEKPEATHYASLIHAKGCVIHDMDGARKLFDSIINPSSSSTAASPDIRPQPCLYQAIFECMVANKCVGDAAPVLKSMAINGIAMTPYIANTLIDGWAAEGEIANARKIYDDIGILKREPSTYEAMTRAYLAVNDRARASATVVEMQSRGYPAAVTGKIMDLIEGLRVIDGAAGEA